jgi:hypothetical protein
MVGRVWEGRWYVAFWSLDRRSFINLPNSFVSRASFSLLTRLVALSIGPEMMHAFLKFPVPRLKSFACTHTDLCLGEKCEDRRLLGDK